MANHLKKKDEPGQPEKMEGAEPPNTVRARPAENKRNGARIADSRPLL